MAKLIDTDLNTTNSLAISAKDSINTQNLTDLNSKVQELTESNEYNRSLIESNMDVLLTTDSLGIINDVNKQICELTECSREELLASPFKSHFEDPKRAEDLIRKVLSENRITNYELVIKSRNEKLTPVSFNATTFRTADGRLKGIFATARDLTEQKRIEDQSYKQQERALQEQLSYNRGLIESSIDVIMVTDTLGIITDVNKQMCAVTGYTPEELIGTQFKDYFTDARRAEDCIRNVLADARVKNYELTIKAKDGKEMVISCNATTFKGTDHNLRGVFAVARDITEQKRLEVESNEQNDKLKEATGFLSNVLESSTAYSIIAEDLEGNILAWNEGARLNYGYTTEEMVGKQNTSILHAPEDIESGRLQAVLNSALKTGKEEGVLESVRKNGERFSASLALTLRKDSDGKPVGYLLISKDITDQKREEVLESKNVELVEQNRLSKEANRLKSEFLANMSHELRSPLNGIIGFTELMYLGKVGPTSAEHKEYLGDILTSARHLLQLINDILDLAKVESGKMDFHPEPIELSVVVNEVCDILRTLIYKNNIKLTIEIDPIVEHVVADPAKLKQILYNYISNALKFTNEKGSIKIIAKPVDDKFFRLEVTDSGIGIREEDIPKLFSEFQQLDSSKNKKYQGTGLGLALTRRIAEAQGGEVGVTSIINVGSTFFATLPRELINSKQAPISIDEISEVVNAEVVNAEIVNAEVVNAEATSSARVLVIDDDEKDNTLIAQTLIKEGYKVDKAYDGINAVKMCEVTKYDAITIDLLLLNLNGWDILRTIRSGGVNLTTPVIVVSVIVNKAASFGYMVNSFITKPINPTELIAKLEQSGVCKDQNKRILFVDDDPKMLSLCKQYLIDYGATVYYETSAEEALKVASLKQPDVVVLDLLMPGVDGLEFLRRFQITEQGEKTPVIICTSQDLNDDDKFKIKSSVEAIIQKGGDAMDELVKVMNKICPHEDDKNR
jgi:PAS domain S-box-containing protein